MNGKETADCDDSWREETGKRKRIMSYFINAAILYHYFSNLDELELFTSVKCLDEYMLETPMHKSGEKNFREWYLEQWRCFCRHSFARPRIYNFLFFSPEGSQNLNEVFRKYYEISEPEIMGLNEMSVLIYRGMLAIMQSENDKPTVEEAVRKTVRYLGKALDAYQLK